MNPKLKLVITILIAIGLLALFFWATTSISSLTGHTITGSSVSSPAGIDSDNSGISTDKLNEEDSNGVQDNPVKG